MDTRRSGRHLETGSSARNAHCGFVSENVIAVRSLERGIVSLERVIERSGAGSGPSPERSSANKGHGSGVQDLRLHRKTGVTSEAGLSIVVVDEQPLVLQALASRLQAGGFVVQAALRTAAEVLEFLRDQTIDVVVLGLPLRGEGAACLRAIRSTAPELIVVVCNASGEGEPDMALAEGAAAFVTTSGDPDDVVTAVRQTVSRSIFLSPAAKRRAVQTKRHVSLTPRELEIVWLAAEGGTNAEIARQLWVTEPTIKFHLANIYRKLGVSNRTEMSRYVQFHGLLTDESREVTQPRSARQARKRSARS